MEAIGSCRYFTKIFIDESGKSNDHPILIGGLQIPRDIYNSDDFTSLHGIHTHWTEFRMRNDMKKILQTLAKYETILSWNVINYNYSAIQMAASEKFAEGQARRISSKAMFSKFPERLAYGLLRENPNYILTDADVIIEKSTGYNTYLEQDKVRDDLNVQSVYRGENFIVSKLYTEGKGVEVGLEATDLFLGIMRHIIQNKPREKSTRVRKKTSFVINALKNEQLLHLFTARGTLFEWHENKALQKVDFNKYVQSFLTRNKDLWF